MGRTNATTKRARSGTSGASSPESKMAEVLTRSEEKSGSPVRARMVRMTLGGLENKFLPCSKALSEEIDCFASERRAGRRDDESGPGREEVGEGGAGMCVPLVA